MKVAPRKKRWQLAYVMGIFCTRDAAVAIETCWEELGRKRSNLDAAATIIDHVAHPHLLFLSHSIFSLTKKNILKAMPVADARGYMMAQQRMSSDIPELVPRTCS